MADPRSSQRLLDDTLRRSTSRRRLLQIGAAGLGAAALGPHLRPSRAAAQATPQRGGTLIIGTAQQIQTLDPHKAGLRNNRNAWVGLFSFLTRYDEEGIPQPMLAESSEVAADGLSWTFKLRSGVKFHNGRELTADDVKFSLDRARDPEVGSSVVNYLRPVAQVDVVDPLTVKITTTQPYGALAAALCPVAIVAPENADQLATNPIGTGPFKLKEYLSGEKLTLEKNPDYWEMAGDGQPLPYLDAVTINTLTDTNALFTSLTTGTVQGFWQMPDQIQVQAEGNADIQLVPALFKTTYDEYFFQADVPPFNDPNVRRALLLALDKEAISEAGYFGRAEPRLNNNINPPGLWAENADIPEIPRDPATAKQLFEAAGVTDLKFLGYTETPQFRPISQVMERNLNEIGVKLTLEFSDLTTWLARIKRGTQDPWGDGNDGNAFTVNISVNPAEPAIPLTSWGCRTHFGSHFCDEALAAAATESAQAFDLEGRKAGYAKYQQLWQQDVPAIITCNRPFTHASLKTVQGLFDDDGALNYRLAWMES
jgi:peptide/nickel transport system substrate-binding protein